MSRKSRALPTSDMGQLKKGVLYRPGAEVLDVPGVWPQAQIPHPDHAVGGQENGERVDVFARALEAHGMEILWLEELLDDALARARAAVALGPWLRAHVPADWQAHLAGAREITGAVLMKALGDARPGCSLRPLVDSMAGPMTGAMAWLQHARDMVVMTPRGAILCNVQSRARALEPALARLLFDHARALQGHTIAFDAVREGVFLTGGDVIVADADTLLVGTGNLTESRAAPMLARTLHMDVVEVRLPGRELFARGHAYDAWTGIHGQHLHLDTIVGLVGTATILAPPYFLEARHLGHDPLTRLLHGLRAEPGVDQGRVGQVLYHLGNVGWVTRYQAGSGDVMPRARNMKLVDHMRDQGYALVPVGGEQGTLGDVDYVVERVLRELGALAAQVTAIAPGKVIARARNAHTNAALRAAGIDVITV